MSQPRAHRLMVRSRLTRSHSELAAINVRCLDSAFPSVLGGGTEVLVRGHNVLYGGAYPCDLDAISGQAVQRRLLLLTVVLAVPVLIAEGVTHRYGRNGSPALNDVTLQLQPGVTGLVGVNGAGKSTLLAVLSGALRPTSGRVSLDGVDLYGRHRMHALSRLALMPQDFQVPVNKSAREVVAYLAWLRGVKGTAVWEAADRALAVVGLTTEANKRFRALSGGMRRRLALAQALAADPKVMLLDEPTTGLDPEQRVMLRALIRQLPDDQITLMSSHVMEDLDSTCERIAVIDEGSLLFDGAIGDFRSRYGGAKKESEFAFLSMVTSRRSLSL